MNRAFSANAALLVVTSTILLALGAGPAYGSGSRTERIVLKDGVVVQGEVVGFRDGHYIIRKGQSTLEIPAREVRTILRADPVQPKPNVASDAFRMRLEDVIDALPLRDHPRVTPESDSIFKEAVAGVLRGEWDVALRELRRLRDRDPDWIEPQLLAAMILIERGESRESIRMAIRLQREFTRDLLAQRVAAEVFRRSGFSHEYAQTMEKVLLDSQRGGRAFRDLAELWWPVNRSKSQQHWQEYLRLDESIELPDVPEAESRRQIEYALSIEDWTAAQVAVDEFAQRFPWAQAQVPPLQREVLEARLRASEAAGSLEEALLTCETLQLLDPARQEEWRARLDGLRSFLLTRALQEDNFDVLRRWSRNSAHLLDPRDPSWRAQLSQRFQEMALRALSRGETGTSRLAFREAHRWDDSVRPQHFDRLLDSVVSRVRDDLMIGRRARALEECAVLREAFPERVQEMVQRLSQVFREVLADSVTSEELNLALLELRGALIPPGSMGKPGGSGNVMADATDTTRTERTVAEARERQEKADRYTNEVARSALMRYFPHAAGTRWVYQRGDGKHETRRVVHVGPAAAGGTEITLRVETEAGEGFNQSIFLRGADLILNANVVPPGEYALRYPFSTNAEWDWKKGMFEFQRKLVRPRKPLHLPTGTYTDYFVVEGENAIESPDGSTYRTSLKVTYVAGIGVARVECDNPALAKTLVEFHPPQ